MTKLIGLLVGAAILTTVFYLNLTNATSVIM
ncbi:hypothetical protein Hbal_2250 [Hirschia baltica ATCC 49814]|uniref:Uncharacterized protein n=1 Tax=Hirschia baltica (strain ATCC 49814 / DSM 5838 / IFAM 1418) TaxID=582402 RepID=C6XML6_HIRBI|nr:hypothetical protein Hbal_2250 [Hirschia baltica ATCC 49814]